MAVTDAAWVRVVSLDELSPGEMTAIEVGERRVAVYRLDTGEVYATDDVCTHAMAFLSEGWLEGDEVECPLHGGRFNVRTGAGLCAPIDQDLRTYPVRIDGADVLVDLSDAGS